MAILASLGFPGPGILLNPPLRHRLGLLPASSLRYIIPPERPGSQAGTGPERHPGNPGPVHTRTVHDMLARDAGIQAG